MPLSLSMRCTPFTRQSLRFYLLPMFVPVLFGEQRQIAERLTDLRAANKPPGEAAAAMGLSKNAVSSEHCAAAGIDRSKAHKAKPLIRRLEGIHHFQLATRFQFATPWSVDRQPAPKPRCSALFCLGDGVSLEP